MNKKNNKKVIIMIDDKKIKYKNKIVELFIRSYINLFINIFN